MAFAHQTVVTTARRGALALVATLTLAASGLASPSADASILRYALIVGTNDGVDANGVRRTPLHHAEHEADELRDALIHHCGFFTGPRTRLLLRPSRDGLLDAIGAFRTQIEEDRVKFPNVEAMFVLFFSGHGAEGSILLNDGPVTGKELVSALDGVGADFQLRIFDACSSASLAGQSKVTAKGMNPTKMFDLIPSLPDQSLNAAGTVWFFSAAEGQTAFEHAEIGGLFTHALIEAMRDARHDEFGIPLDAIWDYTRARTTQLAAEEGRVQTPTRVSRLRSTGPMHLAWLPRAPATLVLGPEISGTLGIFYGGDQMLTIDKAAGTTEERTVYPGQVDIMVTKGGDRRMMKVTLPPGGRVFVDPQSDARPRSPFGRRIVPIVAKGDDASGGVGVGAWAKGVSSERDATTVLLGAEYGLTDGGDLVSSARNVVSAVVRVDHGAWLGQVALGYGFDGEQFPSWSYDSDAVLLAVSGGYGFDIEDVRIAPTLSASGGPVWQSFGDGASQRSWGFMMSGGVDVAVELADGVIAEGAVSGGERLSRGVAVGSTYRWSPALNLTLGIAVRL